MSALVFFWMRDRDVKSQLEGNVCRARLRLSVDSISSATTRRSGYKRDNDIAVGVQTARLIEQSIGKTARGRVSTR